MDFLFDSIFHVDRSFFSFHSFICSRLQLNPWPTLPFTVATHTHEAIYVNCFVYVICICSFLLPSRCHHCRFDQLRERAFAHFGLWLWIAITHVIDLKQWKNAIQFFLARFCHRISKSCDFGIENNQTHFRGGLTKPKQTEWTEQAIFNREL